jgi:hypothetical protein
MGFTEALLLAFIILKLTGAITWAWWIVLAPLYPSVVIWVLLILFGRKLWQRHKRETEQFDEEWQTFDEGWPKL